MGLLLLLALLGSDPEYKVYEAKAVDCYDGDTCVFDIYLGLNVVLRNTTVRFCDVHAPELSVTEERYQAEKARDQLLEWLKEAKIIHLALPQKKTCALTFMGSSSCEKYDKQGKLLAMVYANGNDINEKLLKTKLAKEDYVKCHEE